LRVRRGLSFQPRVHPVPDVNPHGGVANYNATVIDASELKASPPQ
jgi:hypothetical protein